MGKAFSSLGTLFKDVWDDVACVAVYVADDVAAYCTTNGKTCYDIVKVVAAFGGGDDPGGPGAADYGPPPNENNDAVAMTAAIRGTFGATAATKPKKPVPEMVIANGTPHEVIVSCGAQPWAVDQYPGGATCPYGSAFKQPSPYPNVPQWQVCLPPNRPIPPATGSGLPDCGASGVGSAEPCYQTGFAEIPSALFAQYAAATSADPNNPASFPVYVLANGILYVLPPPSALNLSSGGNGTSGKSPPAATVFLQPVNGGFDISLQATVYAVINQGSNSLEAKSCGRAITSTTFYVHLETTAFPGVTLQLAINGKPVAASATFSSVSMQSYFSPVTLTTTTQLPMAWGCLPPDTNTVSLQFAGQPAPTMGTCVTLWDDFVGNGYQQYFSFLDGSQLTVTLIPPGTVSPEPATPPSGACTAPTGALAACGPAAGAKVAADAACITSALLNYRPPNAVAGAWVRRQAALLSASNMGHLHMPPAVQALAAVDGYPCKGAPEGMVPWWAILIPCAVVIVFAAVLGAIAGKNAKLRRV
jgi:hypothetical protein